MRIKVLGSAAGGGVPQWNCNFRYSRLVRAGSGAVRPRLQSSIAASAEPGRGWVLFNASPDLRQQLNDTPELQPDPVGPVRSTPIKAVVLSNADVDHLAGLLSLRERQAFHLYATSRVLSVLEANSIFSVLDPACVTRIPVEPGCRFPLEGPEGPTGLFATLFPVPGKVALFLETGDVAHDFQADEGDTSGVRIEAENGAGRVCYVPGCARLDAALREELAGADVLFFDGTLFRDDEMIRAGVGPKTGARMGHMAIDGPDGSIEALADVSLGRRIYIHINNTNPILEEGSAERRLVEGRGWEIAWDGMEVVP